MPLRRTTTALGARVDAGKNWSGELLIYRRNGTPLWIELAVSPTRDAAGRISGTVAVSQDITARRETVRERQRLAAAALETLLRDADHDLYERKRARRVA